MGMRYETNNENATSRTAPNLQEGTMLTLPFSSSPLRSLFSVADVAEMASPANRHLIPNTQRALMSLRKTVAGDAAIRSATGIAVSCDGDLVLLRVGALGGFKRLWNFGPL